MLDRPFNLDPRPKGLQAPARLMARWQISHNPHFIITDTHTLMHAPLTIAEPEGQPNKKKIEPKKTNDWPRPEGEKHDTHHRKADGKDTHHNRETRIGQGSVRIEQGIKQDRCVFPKICERGNRRPIGAVFGTGAPPLYRGGHCFYLVHSTHREKHNAPPTALQLVTLFELAQDESLVKMTRKLTRKNAHTLYERLAEKTPTPRTELFFKDPFTLVVAVALSAQATDEGVNKATTKLFAIADTPEKIVALGETRLGEYIKTIGLWRNKAKNVIALSKMILDDFGGEVPRDRDALERLPGVGRKTANVVMNVAFDAPTIAVDTHIYRVSNRTGLAPGKTTLAVELALEKITPDEFLKDAHHWLILHGRYICKARKPDCPACSVRDICLYKEKTEITANDKPKPSVKRKKTLTAKKPKKATSKKKKTKGSASS